MVSAALGNLSRSISLLLAAIVVTLAVAAMATSLSVHDIASWMQQVLGLAFLGLFVTLVGVCLFCWVHILRRQGDSQVWLEAGLHAANGITTLALTFTLLGISLGIGSLAEQSLTPETVQAVIRDLTAQFSLAFLTTVIGLPTATLLRALIMVTNAHQRAKKNRPLRLPAR
ncbi:hypothetical protein [Aestuariispira ectoiniformans]|uniref:hypothetical protein n=1 Tax=Aestuariispira ectoiniformans TaxID=2775080 RepID=UPI00223ACCDD|nr:hypothetical protein [Aestuariispira ectoiniformans]